MDFEDGGIETEPKINTDEQEKSLKQPVEPIISFSPERCRFSDSSAQSSSRKGSSTSFPISVADLQLGQPNNGVSPKSTTTSITIPAPHKPSHSHPQPIILDEHPSSTSISTQPSSLFTTASSNPLKPAAFPLFNPSALTTSSSSSSASTSLHHQAPPPSLGVISANTSSSSSQAHRSPSLTDPISLMVNGTVLSANPTSTPTSTSSSSASSSATALDLQKRLEKRIAQASAIAAAQAAQVQVSSSSSTSPKQTTLPASSSAATTSSSETKASTTDSILLTDIIGIANKPGGVAVATTGKNNGNQISFSPPEEKVVSSLDPLWTPEQPSAATEIDDFWESSNKVLASSNQNKLEDGFPLESPVAGESAESGDCFDLTSSTTTSCKNGESTTVADGVNSKSSRTKAKGNQSLRNNNRSTSPPSSSSSSPPTSNVPASSSVSAPPFSSCDKTPSVITVVNASFDIRKVSALLPPQRMAIPSKSSSSNSQSSHHSQLSSAREAKSAKSSGTKNNNNNGALSNNSVTFSAFSNTSNKNSNDTSNPPPPCSSSALSSSSSSGVSSAQKTSSRLASISETQINTSSGNGNIKTGNVSKLSNDSEKKPLVQWDSDESEEELSFFPSTKRGVITDNLSIDNMSLSGEEDDLHLTPPRPLAKKCPCDPRTWLEKADISAGHSHHHHGDPTRVISSKFSCVIC